MTDRVLIPCTACARHVLSNERSCPFCGAARDAAPALALKRTIPKGTSRAAAFALRAALVTATAGCAASHDGDDEPGAEAGSGHPDAMVASDAGAGHDAQLPPRDAAPEASAVVDAAADADDEDGFVPIPIYGGVFPDPRTRAKV